MATSSVEASGETTTPTPITKFDTEAPSPTSPPAPACDLKTHFECHDYFSNCIPKERVCDGQWDCAEGQDEVGGSVLAVRLAALCSLWFRPTALRTSTTTGCRPTRSSTRRAGSSAPTRTTSDARPTASASRRSCCAMGARTVRTAPTRVRGAAVARTPDAAIYARTLPTVRPVRSTPASTPR
jgi:hypothetical protein